MLTGFICSLASLNMFLMLVILQNWWLKKVWHIRTSGNKKLIDITSVSVSVSVQSSGILSVVYRDLSCVRAPDPCDYQLSGGHFSSNINSATVSSTGETVKPSEYSSRLNSHDIELYIMVRIGGMPSADSFICSIRCSVAFCLLLNTSSLIFLLLFSGDGT